METLKALVAQRRERDGTAIAGHNRAAPYSDREFCTDVWKTGNLLGHYGAHPGAEVAVVVGPKEATASDWSDAAGIPDAADPLLAILGATLLGARVTVTPDSPVDARVVVLPAGWREKFDLAPQCSALAYGGPPEDADTDHFETERWSENPVEPPERVESTTPALRAGDETSTHAELLETAGDAVDAFGLDADSRVGVAADLREPGAFAASVLAGLSVGATLVLGEESATTVVTDEMVASVR
jgi:hypothetical protein